MLETGPDTLAVKNWLNLGTELVTRRVPGVGGVLLEGAAADRNFLRYRLEYFHEGIGAAWVPVAPPSTRQVFGDEFQSWIPPGPGVFRIRLVTEDKAGNIRTASQRVFSSDSPTLTDLYVVPEVFSPNGDGVLDTALVQYRLLEPANLEFSFVDESGTTVRSILRSHAEPGDYSFSWDGRSGAGIRVADGTYRVRVLDYQQSVRVDSSPPRLPDLGFSLGAGVCKPEGLPGTALHFRRTYSISLENFSGSLRRGIAPTPAEWTSASEDYISIADALAYIYRVEAEDEAGNRAVAVVHPPEPIVLIGAASAQPSGSVVGPPGETQCSLPFELPENGLLRLEVVENFSAPLATASIFVSPRREDLCDPLLWIEDSIVASYAVGSSLPWGLPLPEQSFEVLWDGSALETGEYCVQLRGIGSNGVAWASNVVSVVANGAEAVLWFSSPLPEEKLVGPTWIRTEFRSLYDEALQVGAIESGSASFILGRVLSSENGLRISNW